MRLAQRIKKRRMVRNAFCPTGPGGGIDPTCSPTAIADWSQTLYRKSAFLSGQEMPSEVDKAQLRKLNEEIELLPNYEGTVHRSLILPKGKEFQGVRKLAKDNTFSANRPLASSKDETTAREFSEMSASPSDTVMMMHFKTKTGKDISQHVSEEYRDQQEVLLRPGTHYVIRGVNKERKGNHGGPVVHVHLEEVHHWKGHEYYRGIGLTDNIFVINPFVSEQQRRACYAKDDPNWDCGEWESKTHGKLPKRKRKKLTTNRNPLRTDPTRTSALRRAFYRAIQSRLNELKRRVNTLVLTEKSFALNVFCATGEGGGIDPTCSPHLKSGPDYTEPGKSDTSEEHFLGVRRLVLDMKDSPTWKYQGEVDVLNESGPEFERGGIKWREAGHCILENGKVVIRTPDVHSVEAVQRITAHEFMHGVFEKVTNEYRKERELAASGDEFTYASGELKPGLEEKFPTYAKLSRFDIGERDKKNPGQWIHIHDQLINDDGITDYSKAYWRDFKEGGKGVTFHLAVHETLAEIAALHETTGTIHGSKVYRDYYKAVRDEYKILTGNKRRPKPKAVENAEQSNHVIYLDHQFKPTNPENATYISEWINGTHRWGVRSEPVENADYKFLTLLSQVEAFRKWLGQQIAMLFGSTTEQIQESFWYQYVQQGFEKGAGRAFDSMAKSLGLEKGMAKWSFLRSAFGNAVSVDKVKLVAGRVFTELKGVTDAMAQGMTRVLADGLAQGQSPRTVAREMIKQVDDIGSKRALVIARTETSRAHAEGQLIAMDKLGAQRLGVQVEWSPSGLGVTKLGNPSPCPECAKYVGKIYTVEKAQGLIPHHPNCLCSWIPYTKFSKKVTTNGQYFYTLNSFCPTGKGGGIDPTCSPTTPKWIAKETDDPIIAKELTEADAAYPRAGEQVSGLIVRDDVPNTDSIGATWASHEYTELPGIRSVAISNFDVSDYKAADDNRRVNQLVAAIKESGEINPLIAVTDHETRAGGKMYALEGNHRLVALKKMGVTHIPAMVIVDHTEPK